MVADVLGLLRPLVTKRLDGIEDLAARLARGATVPPEEVAAVLDRARCGAEDLQAAVDRHRRVAEIRRTMADAEPRRKRLAEIHEELRTLAQAREAASRRENEAIAAHFEEEMTLRHLVEAADRAAAGLMDPLNLAPADAAKLAAVIARADEAERNLSAVRSELSDHRRRLQMAVSELEAAEEAASKFRLNEDAQKWAKRWSVAVKTHGGHAAEAEKALEAATREQETAQRELDATRAAIRKAVNAIR